MNEVDFLLKNIFCDMTFQQKMEIKQLGPHQPIDFVLVNNKAELDKSKGELDRSKGELDKSKGELDKSKGELDKPKGRLDKSKGDLDKPKGMLTFHREWFKRKPWLTASVSKKSLFCFPCLLFGGDTVWANSGYKDLKHLSERIAKHESSTSHMENAVSLQLLGKFNGTEKLDTAYEHDLQHHNQEVDKNRYVLSKIISVLKLCGSCQVGTQKRVETPESLQLGAFLSIFEMLCEGDPLLRNYDNLPAFKGASKAIQNDLLTCMYAIYRDHIMEEIQRANYVSVQVDEMIDRSCKSHLVTIIRYILGNDVTVERFVKLSEVKDKKAAGLATTIKLTLYECEVYKDKLIAQTYCGSAVVQGRLNEVHALVKDEFPYTHFVHCYAHKLDLIMQQLCSTTHKELKVFFAHISGFQSFFSASPKRTSLLNEIVNRKVAQPSAAQRDFNTRAVITIYENLEELKECMEKFQDDLGSDSTTINEAYGLLNVLNDEQFCCILSFFALIMTEVDILYHRLQKRSINITSVNFAIASFKNAMAAIQEQTDILTVVCKDEFPPSSAKKRKVTQTDLSQIMKEVCDTILAHVEDRFSSSYHLIAAKLIDVVLFRDYVCHFPEEELNITTEYYPVLQKTKLKTELCILYGHSYLTSGATSATSLLRSLKQNVKEIFGETIKLLEIILTTPMTTSESGRCFSTLERVKAFLREKTSEEQLNALSMLSIENELIKSIPDFNTKVIERFARLKNRQEHFSYKMLSDFGKEMMSLDSSFNVC